MAYIDLNADIGEAATPQGQAAEAKILELVSSANIACGGHAGSDDTMRATLMAAKANHVRVGAHPGYPDPRHFGRRSQDVTSPRFAKVITRSLMEQIVRLCEIAADMGMDLTYVKPHGALYNDAVKSRPHADIIAGVIAAVDPALILLGAPNSQMGIAAKAAGLTFVAEGFIDRRYTDDGHLQNRAIDGAVLPDIEARIDQAVSLATEQNVITATGQRLSIEAQSLCLHGDSAGAVETARQTRRALESSGLTIRAFAP